VYSSLYLGREGREGVRVCKGSGGGRQAGIVAGKGGCIHIAVLCIFEQFHTLPLSI
jgi:hypothetical protein